MSEDNTDCRFQATLARDVLNDCWEALRELREDPLGQTWRIRWVGSLALLRTVREVLTNVDAKTKPYLKPGIDKWYARMGETKPDIYWNFIMKDTNNILHEYRFSAMQLVTFSVAGEEYKGLRTVKTSATSPAPPTTPLEGERIAEQTYLMKDGPFEGQDQRDVVEEAINWWKEQIDEIELRAAGSAN